MMVAVSLAMAFVLAACDSAGGADSGDDDDDASVTYSISFKLGGTAYEFSAGPKESADGKALKGVPIGTFTKYDATRKWLLLVGVKANVEDDYFSIGGFNWTAAGTYTADMIQIEDGAKSYCKTDDEKPISVTITKYDAVGGVIEGTFSGTVALDNGGDHPSSTELAITDGSFKVLRLTDDTEIK